MSGLAVLLVRPLFVAMVTATYPSEVNGVARTVGLMAEGLQKRGHFNGAPATIRRSRFV